MTDKPIYFYMANLWSEVEKIFIWKEKNDKKSMQSAHRRALSIIARVKSAGNQSATEEAEKIEQILDDLARDNGTYAIPRHQMSSYLKPFALRLLAAPAF